MRVFFRSTFWMMSLALVLLATFAPASAQDEETAAPSPILETLTPLPAATGGVAVHPDGDIYVADIDTQSIYRVTPEGDVELFVDDPQLIGASGNTFDLDGNLYQSSLRNDHIAQITPEGEISIFAGPELGLNSPVGIFIDHDEEIFYVANCGGASVLKIDRDGELISVFRSFLFNCPNGISLDADKNIYVSNFSDGSVLKVDAESGDVGFFAAVPGGNNGHLLFAGDFFYLAARGGARLYTLSLDGELEVFAATGTRGHVDGPVLEARISLPNDLGFSPDGRFIYFNDAEPISGNQNQPSFLKRIDLNPETNEESE